MNILLCLVLFVCAKNVYGGLASFIKPCLPSDLVCLKNSAQGAVPYLAAGVPELGLLPLDPVTIKHMEANEAGLRLRFNDTVIRGLRECTVISLRRLKKRTAIDLKCSVSLVGDYDLSGKLLILPIEGQGRYKINIRDIVVKTLLDIEERVVDGQRYWSVTGWRHSIDMPSFVKYHFQNLFNGDKQLAQQVHTFANESWYDIFKEVAPPITRAIVARIVEETGKLFQKVPLSQLAME